MKILAQLDTSHEGNDCWIYEEWLLVVIFVQEHLICNTKVTGYFNDGLVSKIYNVDNLNDNKIIDIYKKLKRISK